MKKISFLLGTVGGALAGYVLSNKKLRTELRDAKDATAAAKILGRHLSHDGQVVATEVRELAEEHHLDDRLAEGRKYVKNYYKSAKEDVQDFLGAKVKEATKTAIKAKRSVGRKVRAAMR